MRSLVAEGCLAMLQEPFKLVALVADGTGRDPPMFLIIPQKKTWLES